jgi:hypothetical protein
MASRTVSLLSLATVGVASALITFTPSAPAMADEDPYYRVPPRRVTAPPPRRVVRHVPTMRAVWRPRVRCYDYSGYPVDCRTPVIIGYTYGCGGCAPPVVAPPVQYYAPVATTCGACAPAVYAPPPRYYGCCAPAVHPYVHTHRYYGHPRLKYAHRRYGYGVAY